MMESERHSLGNVSIVSVKIEVRKVITGLQASAFKCGYKSESWCMGIQNDWMPPHEDLHVSCRVSSTIVFTMSQP